MTKEEYILWLDKPCSDDDIKANGDGSKFIPIGIIETKLDKFDSWDTTNFKTQIFKTSKFWFASGSVELIVCYAGMRRTMTGAATYPISSKDNNMDYEATILSYCISNAAKKLGKQFGRHLNGRLEKGETAISVIQVEKFEDIPDIDEEITRILSEKSLDAIDLYIKSSSQGWRLRLNTQIKEHITTLQKINQNGN